MRTAVILILLFIAISAVGNAQNPLLVPKPSTDSIGQTEKNFFIVKGDEIRRFPSIDFSQAVNGLFPWVFSQQPNPNEFLFVVDGFILTDINSISLNDIDQIIFTRDNAYGTLFPFSRAGTFLITTRNGENKKLQLNFNTQYNSAWNKKGYLPSGTFGRYDPTKTTNEPHNKPGYYLSNNISLSFGGKKLRGYISAEANSEKHAEIHQHSIFEFGSPPNDTVRSNSFSQFTEQKILLKLNYRFSKKLEAGIMGNYAHEQFKSSSDWQIFSNYTGVDTKQLKTPENYYGAGFFLNYRIVKSLTNTTWFEYLSENLHSVANERLSIQPQQLLYESAFQSIPKNKNYVVRDQLVYNFVSARKFTADASVTFAYLHRNYSAGSYSQLGGSFGYSANWGKEKIASLNPALNFSWNHILSGYVGGAFLIGKKTFKEVSPDDKKRFYSGIEVDFSSLLRSARAVDHLALSVNYSDLLKNNSNNYWLNPVYLTNFFIPLTQFDFGAGPTYSSQPFHPDLLESRLIAIHLSSSFFNNRLQFLAEWSESRLQRNYPVLAPQVTIYVMRNETARGLSLTLSGKIIENSATKLRSTFNVLFPKTAVETTYSPTRPPFEESSLRAGWQTRFEYKHVFAQINLLADIDHVYYAYHRNAYGPVPEKHNDFSANYIVLGFQPSIKGKSALSAVSFFLQARNLFMTKQLREYYLLDHYAGIGVNVSF